MDARGLLTRQGWLGDGHSLDHTGRGIKKPLLVSKKVDVLGLGVNKHAAVSDQWWLKAFDQGLKDLGSGKESLLANVQKLGVKRGGLYGRFVRGEGMVGTIGSGTETSGVSTPVESVDMVETLAVGTKRKREVEDIGSEERKTKRPSKTEKIERQKAKREAKRKSRPESMEDAATRKAAKKARKAEKEARLAGKEAAKAETAVEKAARRAEKQAMMTSTISQPVTANGDGFRTGDGTIVLDGEGERRSLPGVGAEAELARKIEKLSSEKRALYEKRAAAKGISLRLYMIQRKDKSAAKKTQPASVPESPGGLASVIDTTGDSATAPSTNDRIGEPLSKTRVENDPADQVATFAEARERIAQQLPTTILDAETGKATFSYLPSKPVPVDERLWSDLPSSSIKDLPRSIRKARTLWMRQERRKRDDGVKKGTHNAQKKAKGERKIQEREAFVRAILDASRKANGEAKKAEVYGMKNVPLIDVKGREEGKKYAFTKEEVGMARSTARKFLRDRKKEERAGKGRGKGSKKKKK